MEGKNNNKFVVILLVIIILGLVGFIVYDKVLSKDNNTNNTINSNEVIDDNSNNSILKAEDYVIIENTDYDKIKKISFKNLDVSLTQKFLTSQEQLINKLDKIKNECVDCDGINGNSDIWYQINSNILTVYYKLSYDSALGVCSEVLTTNIDLANNKTLSNEEVLGKADYSFNDIALKEYNKTLGYLEEGKKVIDNNYKEITEEEFIKDKNIYINKIVNGLDNAIFVYIQDSIVKYDHSQFSIDILYRGIAKGGCFPIITETVGNLK